MVCLKMAQAVNVFKTIINYLSIYKNKCFFKRVGRIIVSINILLLN